MRYEINGKAYNTTGYVPVNAAGVMVPIVDIPMMSDEQWDELAKRNALATDQSTQRA